MSQSILGMDPISFMLTILSILGIGASVLTFIYHYDPCRQYLCLSEAIDQTWSLFESICNEGLLSSDAQMRLCRYLERLEIELGSLMFVTIPTSTITQKLRGWSKSWCLLCLSIQVQKISIVLLAISKQQRRISHAKREGTVAVSSELEANVKATTERLIKSLGDCGVEAAPLEDLPHHSLFRQSSSSDSVTSCPKSVSQEIFPTISDYLKCPSNSIPVSCHSLPKMPPKSYRPHITRISQIV